MFECSISLVLCVDVSESFAPRPTLHSESQNSLNPPPFIPVEHHCEDISETKDSLPDKDSIFDEEGLLFGDSKSRFYIQHVFFFK